MSVVIDAFQSTNDEIQGVAYMSEDQQDWVNLQKKAHTLAFAARKKPPVNQFRYWMYKVSESSLFQYTILMVIIVNTLVMSSQHFGQPQWWTEVVQVSDVIFGAVYLGELAVKLMGYGLQGYFSEAQNVFDFLICVAVVLGWTYTEGGSEVFQVLELLRVLRVFRLFSFFPGLLSLLRTLRTSAPSLVNIGIILGLVYYIYAVVGMTLFGNIPTKEGVNFSFIK